MSTVDMDAMAAEFEALKANRKSGAKMPRIKLKDGLNRLRILPPFVKGTCWKKFAQSFNNGPEKKTGIVPRRQYGLSPDPFMDYIESLASKNDKASQTLLNGVAGQGGIMPRDRFVMFVIDRDNEAAGPQAWEVSEATVRKIHKWFADPEYGNLADPEKGFDLQVTKTPKAQTQKKKYDEIDVTPRRKETPLSEDPDVAAGWLSEDLFEKYRVGYPTSLEYMQAVLNGDDLKAFKGSWTTRPDGSPVFEDGDAGGDDQQEHAVEQAKQTVSAPKGASAADKIRASLAKK